MKNPLKIPVARRVSGGTCARLARLSSLRLRAGLHIAVMIGAALTAHAAKNPDKPIEKPFEKPKKIEKIERKLERAGLLDEAPAVDSRPIMAAPAPAPERSIRSERVPDRSGRGERTESRQPSLPADAKFDEFRLITERNIFNPTRIGRVRPGAEEKPLRVDTISLVGTMHYDQGAVAFFDGTDTAYRKTLREGQKVGDFKVEVISANDVLLVRDDKTFLLKVPQQLRRVEGSDWTVAAFEGVDDSRGSGSSAARPAEPPPIPANASEALRRLMEQRQKQLKQ